MEKIKNRPVDSEENDTILEQLLLRGLPAKDAVVMVVDMLMAGIDTTSHTAAFLLYHLARNADKQDMLRKEILLVVGPKGSAVTPSALNEMHYLKACLKECLRLNPSAFLNTRNTDKDLVLSGYQVPKGVSFHLLWSKCMAVN